MAVKFYLDTHPNKAGELPIKMSVIILKKRFMPTIGHSVDPAVWNGSRVSKAKYVNSKGETAKDINYTIFTLQTYFTELELEATKIPTPNQFKDHINIALGKKKPKSKKTPKVRTVIDDIQQYMTQEGVDNQWAPATYQCWRTFIKHISTFDANITYKDFDEEGIDKFVRFLRSERMLGERTVEKQYKNLKCFLNWASRKGLCKDDQYKKHRLKLKDISKPIIFLTKEELLKLYKYEVPTNGTEVTLIDINGNEYTKIVRDAGALAKTRDLFCFCCFTSLRYSDMAKLKRTDINGDIMYVTTQKTNDTLEINLNKQAQSILDKYKNCTFEKGLALPVISNQKMNNYIKDLCELCGFNEPITEAYYKAGKRVEETYPKWALIGTHAGRRTFVCFALSQGIPPQVVMKWTGHSDYKAMRPYIEIAGKIKAEAMNVFEKGLE